MNLKILSAVMAFMSTFASVAKDVVIPESLKRGDKIALVTPASAQDSTPINTAVARLRAAGYDPVIFPHALGRNFGSYPATPEDRAADLMAAFSSPEIKAILCTRGGYGSAQLLPMLDPEIIKANPKWLIGYSDISALHALMYHCGVASIHGPMTGHIAEEPMTDAATTHLMTLLSHGLPLQYDVKPHAYNNAGVAKGRVVGGNLLVLNGLAETPYDLLNHGIDQDVILFLEDVSEPIYAIERVLIRLHQSGALAKVRGLIIGRFTEYKPDRDFASMEDMIHHWLKKWGYYKRIPIVFGFPVGHVTANYPMVEGANATLRVAPDAVTLTFSKD